MSADYQRGYNRGKASAQPRLDEYRRAIVSANERAQRAERGVCGPCQECARWTRHHTTAHWGYCQPPDSVTVDHENWWGEPGHKVCTQEKFGCVRFETKAVSVPEAST